MKLGWVVPIEADFESLDIKNNLKYFLATLFIKETFENEVINEIEKRSVQDLIWSKNEESIMSVGVLPIKCMNIWYFLSIYSYLGNIIIRHMKHNET